MFHSSCHLYKQNENHNQNNDWLENTQPPIITKIITDCKICSHLWTAVYNRVPTFFIQIKYIRITDTQYRGRMLKKKRKKKKKRNSDKIRGGADKFLARPGRKQATATKLKIYSTCSPRSSIHFLVRFSKFCKALKKNSEGCPSNQVSAAAITSASDEKWWHFNCFFSPGYRW